MPHPSPPPPPPPHPLRPNAHYSTFLSFTRQYFVGGVGVGDSDLGDQYLDPLHVNRFRNRTYNTSNTQQTQIPSEAEILSMS